MSRVGMDWPSDEANKSAGFEMGGGDSEGMGSRELELEGYERILVYGNHG